jgi:hypothetical protein
MRRGDRCICRGGIWRCLALLWVEIFEVYLGEKSGSSAAVEVGDGARYRMLFLRLLGMFR